MKNKTGIVVNLINVCEIFAEDASCAPTFSNLSVPNQFIISVE